MSTLALTMAFAIPAFAVLPHQSMEYHDSVPQRMLTDSPPKSLRFFTQRQDHFDGSNANTWQQAYYVNDTFWKGPESKAPVFLCVGGEGPPLTPAVVDNSVHCSNAAEWLEEMGALMFAVEHRYYGCHNMSACPVSSFAQPREALKFLSSRQALGDLAEFHSFATSEYQLTSDNKWVSFGGSYPGMLAGWFRVKFPHLVHAAVASSAPVHAQVEMPEYNDRVAYAFSAASVGGSPNCTAAIADGHVKIAKMMNSSDGRQKLAEMFPQVPSSTFLETREGQRAFAGEGVAGFPAQSNDPACTEEACNIEKICKIMTAPNDTICNVHRLASVAQTQEVSMLSFKVKDGEFANYWGWQTCNEFGFYQTCDVGSKCMYAQGLDVLADQIAFCQNDFGISPETVAANVKYTNVYYGGLKPSATRVLWPNGEVDPWATLSILDSPAASQPTLWVEGASHHAWTHPTLPTDQKSVVDARVKIREQVKAWLAEK